jgi:serine/threonine protein kinase
MQEFQPNDTIAIRYKVIRKLGAGAMGSVYLCEDSVENNIKVALKVLVSENIDDQDIWAKGEYEALTRLRHPNLARVFNFGRIGDSRDYFIVSEFIKGIDLYSATEYLNYEELVDIIVQISRALEYIHSQGYVHFDIKPDNILVTRYKTVGIKEGSKVQYTEADLSSSKRSVFAKPNVKLIDFGLAEKITGSFNFAIKGTLNYLAPEILNGMTPDKRADLYSLGVTLYQVANRDLPFYQDSDNIFATAAPAKRSDLFGIHMKKHPEFLRLLILKLIEERPEDRFQSAKEIIQFINKHSEYHFDVETAETRASYFYSPKLVARRREINLLKEYHERAFFPHRWQERRTRAVLQEQRKRALIAAGEVGTAVLRAGDVGALPSVDSRSDPDAANGAAATGPEVRTLAATEANEVPTEARLEKEVSTPSEAIPAPAAEHPEAEVDATQLEAEELDADLDADDLDDPSLELDGVLDGDAAGSGDDCLPTADLPALILVSGEMGSGKSRLLEEFQHYLKLNDLSLFVGNCYEGNNKAYQPFLEALRQLVFAFGLDSELYRKYSQDLLKLLPELPAKKDELELAVGFRADKEKLYFIERIAQLFIEAAQSSPYILIINNLHWVDEASTDLLKHFLRRLAELRTKSEQVTMLVLASVRPEELHLDHVRDLLSELKKAGECREIPVRRLKHSQIREFLCAMLNFSGVPEDFVRKLEEKTGGNPLFIVETLKALQEDGVLRMVGDGWVIKATNYDRIEIPQSMEDLLEKRLGKIPAQRREILDILSVLDKPVNPKFIQGIERFREIPLLVELRDLEATGLITKTFDGGKLHFQIAQPKVREILYSRIEAEKRKKIPRGSRRGVPRGVPGQRRRDPGGARLPLPAQRPARESAGARPESRRPAESDLRERARLRVLPLRVGAGRGRRDPAPSVGRDPGEAGRHLHDDGLLRASGAKLRGPARNGGPEEPRPAARRENLYRARQGVRDSGRLRASAQVLQGRQELPRHVRQEEVGLGEDSRLQQHRLGLRLHGQVREGDGHLDRGPPGHRRHARADRARHGVQHHRQRELLQGQHARGHRVPPAQPADPRELREHSRDHHLPQQSRERSHGRQRVRRGGRALPASAPDERADRRPLRQGGEPAQLRQALFRHRARGARVGSHG